MADQKIYVDQTALSIQLDTLIDLTSMSAGKIKYVKPDETTGEWTATEGDPGVLVFDITVAGEIDQVGTWKVWAYVEFSGGSFAPGDPVTFRVYAEGQ